MTLLFLSMFSRNFFLSYSLFVALFKMSRSKFWVFTLNNYCDEEIETFKTFEHLSYIVFGKETGENGTPHLQGYLEIKNARGLKWLKTNLSQRAAFFIRRAKNVQDAIDYCKKDNNDIYERGTPFVPDEEEKPRKSTQISLIYKDIFDNNLKKSQLIEKYQEKYFIHEKQIISMYNHKLHMLSRSKTNKPQVHYIYGDTLTGKSSYVVEKFGMDKVYILSFSGNDKQMHQTWYDGYSGEECLLIEEYYHQMDSNLLSLLDRYPMKLPIKGNFTYNCWDYVFFTSNYPPEAAFAYFEKDKECALFHRISTITELRWDDAWENISIKHHKELHLNITTSIQRHGHFSINNNEIIEDKYNLIMKEYVDENKNDEGDIKTEDDHENLPFEQEFDNLVIQKRQTLFPVEKRKEAPCTLRHRVVAHPLRRTVTEVISDNEGDEDDAKYTVSDTE